MRWSPSGHGGSGAGAALTAGAAGTFQTSEKSESQHATPSGMAITASEPSDTAVLAAILVLHPGPAQAKRTSFRQALRRLCRRPFP
jgi:hypothetical protein